jgi:hypothetical protein
MVVRVMISDLSGELVDGPDHVCARASPPLRHFNDSERKHGFQASSFNKTLLKV